MADNWYGDTNLGGYSSILAGIDPETGLPYGVSPDSYEMALLFMENPWMLDEMGQSYTDLPYQFESADILGMQEGPVYIGPQGNDFDYMQAVEDQAMYDAQTAMINDFMSGGPTPQDITDYNWAYQQAQNLFDQTGATSPILTSTGPTGTIPNPINYLPDLDAVDLQPILDAQGPMPEGYAGLGGTAGMGEVYTPEMGPEAPPSVLDRLLGALNTTGGNLLQQGVIGAPLLGDLGLTDIISLIGQGVGATGDFLGDLMSGDITSFNNLGVTSPTVDSSWLTSPTGTTGTLGMIGGTGVPIGAGMASASQYPSSIASPIYGTGTGSAGTTGVASGDGNWFNTDYLYNIPEPIMYPELPSMQGVLSGIEQPGYVGYDIAQYGVPDIASMMPTSDWFGNIAPEVMAGIMQPYEKGSERLMEQLNAVGGLGSQRAGVSGSAAAGLGEYWGTAMPQVGMSAWNMTSPALQAGWQANLNKSMYDTANINQQLQEEAKYLQDLSQQQYGFRQQENLQDYNAMLEKARSDYNAMQNYRGDVLTANQFPYQTLPGMLGGTYSTPTISQGTDWLGATGAGLYNYATADDQNKWLSGLGAFFGSL